MDFKNLIKDLEFFSMQAKYELQTGLLKQANEIIHLKSNSFQAARISRESLIQLELVLLERVLKENLYFVETDVKSFEHLLLPQLVLKFYRGNRVLVTLVRILHETNNLAAIQISDETYKAIEYLIDGACHTYLVELNVALGSGDEALDMKVLEITYEQD